MKHCDKCGTFFSDSLSQCPKCNPVSDMLREAGESSPAASKKTVKKQWIAILIGIPSMILLYYLVIGLLKLVSAS